MTTSIEPLFTPFTLRSATLRSRIVMSPMTRCFSPGGVPGQNVADYYRRRAEAGVGLVITEGIGIDHPAALGHGSMGEENVPVLHGERALAGWRRVVNDVHAVDGLIVPQLWHMGAIRVEGTGAFPEAPSCRTSMSDAEISDVIAAYARSAANARAVGFDGVAIHGAHGYLIDTFFWEGTNHRRDAWGGDIVARTRFGAEVVKAIRREIGSELPIVLRWSQWKQQDYAAKLARTPQELESFLRPLVDAGVDLFDISTRIFSAPAFEGSEMTLAGWTRKLSGKPTMAVGGVGLSKDLQSSFAGGTVAINNLDQVMERFERQEFDLLAVGRSLLIDPQWALKARANQPFEPFGLQHYGELR